MMFRKFYFVFLFLLGILYINSVESIVLNISVDKQECYVGEEINISVTIDPGIKGVYGVVYFSKINGSIEELVNYPRGCSVCGVRKSPINFYFHKVFNKKFENAGIYEIFGEIEDVDYQERKYASIKIFVKEKENKTKIEKSESKNTTINITVNYDNNVTNITNTTSNKIKEEILKATISIINFILKFFVY